MHCITSALHSYKRMFKTNCRLTLSMHSFRWFLLHYDSIEFIIFPFLFSFLRWLRCYSNVQTYAEQTKSKRLKAFSWRSLCWTESVSHSNSWATEKVFHKQSSHNTRSLFVIKNTLFTHAHARRQIKGVRLLAVSNTNGNIYSHRCVNFVFHFIFNFLLESFVWPTMIFDIFILESQNIQSTYLFVWNGSVSVDGLNAVHLINSMNSCDYVTQPDFLFFLIWFHRLQILFYCG